MFAEFGVFSSIIVAAAVAFFVGFLWHGPLFGRQWMALAKVGKKEIAAAKKKGMGGMGKQMLANFATNLVMAFVLVYVLSLAGAATILDATMVAFWIWLGFIATVQLSSVLWEKMSLGMYTFKAVYNLVSLAIMANVILLVSVL